MAPNFDNDAILDIHIEDLPDEAKEIVNKAMAEFEKKCLLSFSKRRSEKKIVQKSDLPIVLLAGHSSRVTTEEKQVFLKIMHKIICETMHNHNASFLKTFWNIMAAFNGLENIP